MLNYTDWSQTKTIHSSHRHYEIIIWNLKEKKVNIDVGKYENVQNLLDL